MTGEKEIVFKYPAENGGAYKDREFLKTYWELVIALNELVPEDRSYGNLSIGGTSSMCRARCKAIVDKAKIMEQTMKAITTGRK